MRLLFLGNNKDIVEKKLRHVSHAGIGVDTFKCLEDMKHALSIGTYDFLIMENSFSKSDFGSWLFDLRVSVISASTYVIMMADTSKERTAFLENGADDCVPSAICGEELLARINAMARRPRDVVSESLSYGDLSFCRNERLVRIRNEVVPLQRRETAILEFLLQRPSKVVPRAVLEHGIYGLHGDVCPNALEVRISRIRRCLQQMSSSTAIETVRGVGYRLAERSKPVKQNKYPAGPASYCRPNTDFSRYGASELK